MLCLWEMGAYNKELLAKKGKSGKSSKNATRAGKRQ